MTEIEEQTDNSLETKKESSDEKPNEVKTLTPEEQLKFLMATAQILIKNSNVLVEKVTKLEEELSYLYTKVGHVKPVKPVEEENKEEKQEAKTNA